MMQLIKSLVIALSCMAFAAQVHAQTIKGTVKDTTGKGLPYITINLKDRVSNAILAYGVTDNKGSFVLPAPDNIPAGNISLEARGMGYQTVVKNITAFDAAVDIVLPETAIQLQEVVVKSERPVLRTSGDTLSYKVSEFAGPQDRKIIEVIRKLPGIAVAADGTISYNNKPVSAVYIGGDNLLNDKYSIATNSIPQGAVNLVQVIQNEQPVKALQNKVMSEDVALNLEFKKGAKLHLMGQESIGIGLPGNYDIDLNAMMFKDKYKAINYLGGNNTGYDVQRDLVSHNTMDYLQRTDYAMPAPTLSLGTMNTPALAENRYLFNRAGVINGNNLFNLKKNVQLKLNAFYVHDAQQQGYHQQTTVFLPTDTVQYNEAQQQRIVPEIFHAQFTLQVNREQYYLNDVLLTDHTNTSRYSALNTGTTAVNQSLQDRIQLFSNEFNLIKTLRSNRIIQGYSFISHSSSPENLVIEPGYNPELFNNNKPYAQLVQNVHIPGWYTHNYFSFKIPASLVTQSYRAGFSLQSQQMLSDLSVVQNDHSVNLPSDSALNHVNWTKRKLYAEAAYDLPGTILKAHLSLPLILQQINYAEHSYALDKNIRRLYFSPQLNVKYQLGTENYLSFIYSRREQAGTIQNVYPGYVLVNYRTLHAYNAGLTEQRYQQAGASFSYRKSLTLFFWSISALYNRTASNNIVSSVITDNMQKTVVSPYPNNTDAWIVSGTISKYVFPLRTTFSGGAEWRNSRSVEIQNNALLPFSTISKAINLNVDSKLGKNIQLSYKAMFTQTSSLSSSGASFHFNQLIQQASVHYSPIEALQFKLSGEYYYTRQQPNPDLRYFFADASIKFRAVKWKTDLELSAVNFLDTKTYKAVYLSANEFSSSSYALPGRIVMIKVQFNL